MKIRDHGHRWPAVAALLIVSAVTALSLAACKGSGTLTLHNETLGVEGSVTGEWNIGAGGGEGKVTRSPGDAAVDLKFTGPDGVETGTRPNVQVGQRFPIPAGTTSAVVTGVRGGGVGGNPAPQIAQGRRAAAPIEYFIVVIPLNASIDSDDADWGPSANVYADFRYRSAQQLTQQQLFDVVAPYVAAEIGQHPALAPGLDVRLLARVVPNANGRGGHLYVTDKTTSIDAFRFVLNNVEIATLDHDSIRFDGANGWKVVEVELEWTDFNITPSGGSSNTFDLLIDTAERPLTGMSALAEYS